MGCGVRRSHSWLIGGWVLWPAASDAEEAAKGQEEEGRGRGGGGGGEAEEEESRVRAFPDAPEFSAADASKPGFESSQALHSRPQSSSIPVSTCLDAVIWDLCIRGPAKLLAPLAEAARPSTLLVPYLVCDE